MWAAFWAAQKSQRIGDILADDIVGYWQGDPETGAGTRAYEGKIVELIGRHPDLRLELIDCADSGRQLEASSSIFLHYIGTGTGPAGPFAIRGLDRVRTRDGIVVENVIRYDQVELEAS